MKRAFVTVGVAYVAALVVAVLAGRVVAPDHPIAVAWWADVAATVAIFAFSLAYRNSSFYDAYWSVAPIAIAFYWLSTPESGDVDGVRRVLVTALVCLWGARLTFNWARGWQGLSHEDWRYVGLQQKTGGAYWLVSFFGIHLMPTVWVFLGCLSLYPALSVGTAGPGLLDALAALVTAGGIWIEARADKELVAFRASRPAAGALLRSGVWSRSRHPNYFGEMSFWWGLWLFSLAASPAPARYWWTILGPASIPLMFRFVSLPMIEKRMLERRPDYPGYQATTPLVIPSLRRGEA